MKASQLNLRGTAYLAAMDFENHYPGTVFTSGRRALPDQARAMAQNIAQNRNFIRATYRAPLCAAARAAQKWVDANPAVLAVDKLAAGLLATLQTFSDAELSLMSCHLSGDAFDVEPDGMTEKDDFLRALAVKYKGKFLDKEGGLRRRHWQARP